VHPVLVILFQAFVTDVGRSGCFPSPRSRAHTQISLATSEL